MTPVWKATQTSVRKDAGENTPTSYSSVNLLSRQVDLVSAVASLVFFREWELQLGPRVWKVLIVAIGCVY